MVTPQTNTTLEEIATELLKHQTFCICGHVNPDGDCIGSTLGLTCALRDLGKHVIPLLAGNAKIGSDMAFLPNAQDLVSADDFEGCCDVFVMVDAPSPARMGESASRIRESAKLTITIDHHAFSERVSDLSYTEPNITSTTMLIWELAKHLGIDVSGKRSEGLATCIYTGLLTDSNSFMNSNTNSATFKCASELVSAGACPSSISAHIFESRSIASLKADGIAVDNTEFVESSNGKTVALSYLTSDELKSIGATYEEADHTINVVRSLDGINVACILKERGGCVRGSLRAKDDTDVAKIAKEYGGGGHRAAAGFTLNMSITSAIRIITERLSEVI